MAASKAQFVVLLNNDTEVLSGDWIDQLLFLLEDDDVAAVSPVLVYPDGTIQHAGVALGMRNGSSRVARRRPAFRWTIRSAVLHP